MPIVCLLPLPLQDSAKKWAQENYSMSGIGHEEVVKAVFMASTTPPLLLARLFWM
jgi:hypothetical protein